MVEVVQKLSEKILAAIQTGNLQPVDSLISNNAVFVHMGVCLDKKSRRNRACTSRNTCRRIEKRG